MVNSPTFGVYSRYQNDNTPAETTDSISATNFGFTIPQASIIVGVAVHNEHYYISGAPSYVYIDSVQMTIHYIENIIS